MWPRDPEARRKLSGEYEDDSEAEAKRRLQEADAILQAKAQAKEQKAIRHACNAVPCRAPSLCTLRAS